MPELPEVETLKTELHRDLAGLVLLKAVIFQPSLVMADAKSLPGILSGKKISAVSRRAKYIVVQFEGEIALWIHLGMTGRLYWADSEAENARHVHLQFHFEGKPGKLLLQDPRRFGAVYLTQGKEDGWPESLRKLGPEPLEISETEFSDLFQNRSGSIKNLLLNQRILAGMGNIYADESLFRAGIRPQRKAGRIQTPVLSGLYRAVHEVLTEAIRFGGSSIDDYRRTDGTRGDFQERHRVYGRTGKPCVSCETPIRRLVISGRSAHYCPRCQK